MPLAGSETALAAALKTALEADPAIVPNASLDTLCNAIATVVLAHIVANAVVSGTGGGAAPVVGVIL